ncbi:enediyne antibiotic chromoprotein [Amycolatopsis sp. NPDC003865]
MTSSLRFTTTAVIAIGALLSCTGTALAASPALSVDPATGLNDGQAVSVSASGFPAGEAVTVLQCANSETDIACDTANQGTSTTDDTGTAVAGYTVHSGFDGVNPLTGASSGPVDCTTEPGCSLIALDSSFNYASAAISFG